MPLESYNVEDGSIDLDFTGVEETRVLAEGIYPARVDDAAIKHSNNSGQLTLYLTFEITGPEKYIGRKLFFAVSLQPQARGILQSVLQGLGFPIDDLKGPVRLTPARLLDQACGVRVTTQTYEGELRNRVTRVIPISKVPAESLAGPEAPFEGSSETSSPNSIF